VDEAVDVAKDLAGIDENQTVRLIYYPKSRSVFNQYFSLISMLSEVTLNPISQIETYLQEIQMQPLMLMPFTLQ
jgi:hypothetical protein